MSARKNREKTPSKKTKCQREQTREGRGVGTEKRAEGGTTTPTKMIVHEGQKDMEATGRNERRKTQLCASRELPYAEKYYGRSKKGCQ